LAGTGTAGLAAARALFRAPFELWPREVLLIDCGSVEEHNAMTCPEYARYFGWLKGLAAQDLIRIWTRGHVGTEVFDGHVEEMDWGSWVFSGEPDELLVSLAGLDDFQSRICLVQDLRALAAERRPKVIHIQIGLARDMGVVSTFGNRLEDPCPACFLPHLPVREPCVVLGKGGTLVRGDLQREAWACARLAVRIVCECLGGRIARWVNGKTSFTASVAGFRRKARRRQAMPGCYGAHYVTTPIRWDRVGLPAFQEM
jgi:hypothetical protein